MPRYAVPMGTPDISRFARTLARELQSELGTATPSHLRLMNMLARAAGFRNFQHLRASSNARGRLQDTLKGEGDYVQVKRALAHYDGAGRLSSWPGRNRIQKLVLWVFWADLPARKALPESGVNAHLEAGQTLDDPATIRRMLVGLGRVKRERDGSSYMRVEGPLPPEAVELIGYVRARRGAANDGA